MATPTRENSGRVVLIAVDGSHNSENAFQSLFTPFNIGIRSVYSKKVGFRTTPKNVLKIRYVTHLHTEETKVTLLHVFEVPTLQSGRYHVEPESDFLTWKSRTSEVEMEAQKLMKRFMDRCAAYKDLVHYTPLTLPGRVGETICEEAAKQKTDFIVIGSRGLGKISRSLFGSVSDYVVRRANIPVIVIPKGWKSE